MTVYADVLVAVNYAVNLLILLAAAKLMGAAVPRKRLFWAALLGAVGSLVIFLPYIGGWFQLLYKLGLTVGMTAAAFGCRPWQRFAKALLMLAAVSFVFAGVMLALYILLSPSGMMFYNGVVYFNIPALLLIACTTAAYLLLTLLDYLFFSRVKERELYDLTVTVSGRTISCKGLADTGSSLREPFSGAPVIVCDSALAQRIRPEEGQGIRVIPCLTVTGEAALEGFQPDEILISGEGREIRTTDCYIAASRQPIRGEYQALINPQLINRG